MRRIAIAVLVIGLMSQIGIGIYEVSVNTGITDEPEGEELPGSDIETITVTDIRIGDQIVYEYSLFAQLHSENKTSGEWERYTLEGRGDLLQFVDELIDMRDGFEISHKAVRMVYETDAKFSAKMEGSDQDTVTIPGELIVDRSEYRNLYDNHYLMTSNAGSLGLEGVGTKWGDVGNLPVNLRYTADLKTYPDPSQEPMETLDEAIYGKGQQLDLQSEGEVDPDPRFQDLYEAYKWRVEGAYVLNDMDTFKINVTSKYIDWIEFRREFFITADFPFPLKGFTRTNSSYEDETYKFYMVLETTREIKSLRAGENEVNWGSTLGHNDYVSRHPAGEFETWKYAPAPGSELERSAFNGFTLDDAILHAKTNSTELSAFLQEYERQGLVLVDGTGYNVSEQGGKKTRYWNITFAKVFSRGEAEGLDWEDWPDWAYRILVAQDIERVSGKNQVTTYIAKDEGDDRHGRIRGGIYEEHLNAGSELLTFTSAERIFRIDDQVKAEAFDDNKLSEDVGLGYGITGSGEDNSPGMVLISQLTGITTPTSDNAYAIQKQTVWESGATFSAAVDANTGQLLYVTSVEGSELASIFGG